MTKQDADPMHAGENRPREQKANGVGRKVTISDIAREAGVSKTAVSFAFNMPGRLSEKTARHILDIARQLGYTPNPIARSLNTRRTNALGVLVPQDIPTVMSNPFFAELLSGIGEVCDEEGLSLMLVPPMRGSLVEATYAALVDGCIVTGLEADDKAVRALKLRQIPFVMVDVDAPANITSVSIDDFSGGYAALKHVLYRGHRHIAIVAFASLTGRIEDYTGTLKHRFEGYCRALNERGLTLHGPGMQVLECACSVAGGHEAMRSVLRQSPRPTAIVALSDVIAFGLIEAAREAGLQIPQDVCIVGFDDVEASQMMNPPLTTVRQPIREKGRRAVDLLVQMLRADMPPSAQHICLPVELVVRESCP